jgi:hypothetical protein
MNNRWKQHAHEIGPSRAAQIIESTTHSSQIEVEIECERRNSSETDVEVDEEEKPNWRAEAALGSLWGDRDPGTPSEC